MGQRSSTETLIGVFTAFWRQRTWSQAELAKKLDVNPRTVRKVLDELVLNGWPFEREEDHPHVYWSLPNDFLPGGLLLAPEQADLLLRVIARSPESQERDALVSALGGSLPAPAIALLEKLWPSPMNEAERRALRAIEDALRQRRALRVNYFSQTRGVVAWRVMSVQRVLLGPPCRCIAWCHEVKALRWFRLDSFHEAVLPDATEYVEVPVEEIDALAAQSVGGFASGAPIRVAFRVRDPEARWVAGNLPEGLLGERDAEGLRVDAETAGLVTVARFVVGLGAAATVETPELARAVRELAEGALAGARRSGVQ